MKKQKIKQKGFIKNSSLIIIILVVLISIIIAWIFLYAKNNSEFEEEPEDLIFQEELKEGQDSKIIPSEEIESYEQNNNYLEEKENELKISDLPEKTIEDPQEKENKMDIFIQCLADAGVVIYGSKTCPACASLANSFGGYEAIESIYIECSEKWELCTEKEIQYVPTIFINDEKYSGSRSLDNLAQETGCNF